MFKLTTADSKLLVLLAEVSGRMVSILVDSGSSTQFMSESLAIESALPLTEEKVGNVVWLARGDKTAEPLQEIFLLHRTFL
jgi:predicted aspartyl protease